MTAKRAIWGIRVVIYGSLALAALLVLGHRGAHEPETGPMTLLGKTAQGHHVSVSARDGRVFRVGAIVELRCLDGSLRVSAVSASGGTIVTDGDRVRVRATLPWDATRAFTHHLRVDARREGASISGTVDDAVTQTGESRRVCAGRVAFSAHE